MPGLVDLHCDFANNFVPPPRFLAAGLRSARRYTYDFQQRYAGDDLFAVDYPSLAAADARLVVANIHAPLVYDGQPLAHVLAVADMVLQTLEQTPGVCWVRDRAGLNVAQRERQIAVVLGVENADVFQRDLNILSALHRLGLRTCTLAWYGRNCVCDSGKESSAVGLSTFGRQAVRRMVELGMLIDVSHMNAAGIGECLELARGRGVFASHTNCAALCPHTRNLADEWLRRLAEAGGCVGITFVPQFLNGSERADVADVVRHIRHAVEVMGAAHVALGTDFDGADERVTGLERIDQIGHLAEALLRAGFSGELVEAVFWRNAWRFLEANLR